MTIKTIQQEEKYVPAFDYKDGRFNVRTEIQTWNTTEGGDPELVKTTVHRGVIDTTNVFEKDSDAQRNAIDVQNKIDALATQVVGVAAIAQEGIIRTHEAQKLADDTTIAAERQQKEIKANECAEHEKTIERLEAVIAELQKVTA